MLWHHLNNDSFSFIHIARTGGRSVTNSLRKSGYYVKNPNNALFNSKQIMHLSLKDELDFYFNEIHSCKKICIVRNPIERFISSSYRIQSFFDFFDIDFYELEDYENFVYYMKTHIYYIVIDNLPIYFKGIINHPSNWYLPQIEYVDDSVDVWKYENGLNQNFVNFLEEHNVFVKKEHIFSEKESLHDVDRHSDKLTSKILDNVEKYYHDDMVKFGYA
jgi:hypothetical protein